MNSSKSYKYINLLIKIVVGLVALWFIYFKLKDEFFMNLSRVNLKGINFGLLTVSFVLMFINWGLESYKWKQSIKKTEKINLFKAIGITFTAITASIITPNRIGEVPVRALLLNRNKFKELTSRTIVSSFSQMIITILIGTIGFVVVSFYFDIIINPYIILTLCVFISILTLLLYYNAERVKRILHIIPFFERKRIGNSLSDFTSQELTNLLLLSLIRYIVFAFQFYIVLLAFGVELIGWKQWFLIAVCFLFTSVIPTILISEIGVRGSVALLVFSVVSDSSLMIVLASITLWVINVAFPAIIGLININQLKVIVKR